MEKMIVLPPITSAIKAIAVMLTPGDRVRIRRPDRRSPSSCSTVVHVHTLRVSSATSAAFPNFSLACRRASSGDIPRSMLSSVSRSRWSLMSSSRPSSARLPRMMSLLCGGAQDPRNRAGQRVPLACFDLQLLAAFGGERVELGAAIVLGDAFVEGDPAPLDQPVQSWIKRSLFDLQHIVRPALDRFGNGVTMRRT